MRMIQWCVPPSAGSLQVWHGPGQTRPDRRVWAWCPEDTLDAELTVRENLLVYARYFGMSWRGARRAAERWSCATG